MGRLMKYDLRAAMRLFIPLWLGTLALGLINRFTVRLEFSENHVLNFFTGMAMVLYVLAVLSILVVTLIYIIQRFYQSMLKDEGYLTFTLPVGIDSILWSKALTALILVAGSAIVAFASLMILLVWNVNAEEFMRFFREIRQYLGDITLTAVTFCVLAAASTVCNVILIYLSMALGQLAQKHRLAASVGAFVLINMATSMLYSLVLGPVVMRLTESMEFPNLNPMAIVNLAFGVLILNCLILTAVYYFPTRYIFKRKLNLE